MRFALAAVLAALASGAAAQDITAHVREGIGVPMKPHDAAAGPWTLFSGGKAVCMARFSAEAGAGGIYPARLGPDCAAELPGGIAGWRPVTDGLALVAADGAILVDFNQWTPADLVARRGAAPFLELKRTAPAP